MNILLCGASGFLGRSIARSLRAAGHHVVEGRSSEMNFSTDHDPRVWLPRLANVDAVVNAVGILRDTPRRKLDAIHHRAPAALFEACAQAGVKRVVQISANGVAQSATRYATTKRAADDALLRLRAAGQLNGSVLRPSLIFGRGGASTALFMMLARLPVLVLPGAAVQARVQPVAVPDVAHAVLRLLEDGGPEVVTAVGPTALTLAGYLAELRRQLGHGRALVVPLPEAPSRWSARLGDAVRGQPWSSEALALLQQENVGDADAFARVLGRPAIPLDRFLEAAWASGS